MTRLAARRRGRPTAAAGRGGAPPREAAAAAPGLPWILPAVVLVVGLIYFSIGYTGYVSTLDWNGFILSPSEPVGADNYTAMLADPVFWRAIWHTAFFFVVTFTVQTVARLRVRGAAALAASGFGGLYKVLVFVPDRARPRRPWRRCSGRSSTPTASSTAPRRRRPRGAHPGLARGATTAMAVVMAITVWQWTGLTFILFYAAMSQIDRRSSRPPGSTAPGTSARCVASSGRCAGARRSRWRCSASSVR